MKLLALLLLLGGPGDAEDLLAALSDPNYQTRRKAVLAVEGREDPELLDRLIEIAESDPNSNIRCYAAEVLGTFGKDERVFPLLAKMATEEEYGPRTHAYVALGILKDPRGRQILLDGLDAGRGLRGYAAKGLGLYGDKETFPVVARLLREHADDPYVADLAPEALERLSLPEALEFLRSRFESLPDYARTSVARVLGRNPDEKTREMMERLLKSDDRSLRLPAIRILRDLADPDSIPAILAHLERQPADRAVIFETLGRIGDPRAAKPLIAALRSETDLLAKMRLIEALGRLGDKAALEVLLPLVHDSTLLAQPKRISAIWGFPRNTRVNSAAAWAILKVRTGKEPFPLADTARFPDGDPPPHVAKRIAELRR